MKILIIDNYDSFTFNLYQYIGEILLQQEKKFSIDIFKNDKLSLSQIKKRKYDKIVISPGPGSPSDERYFGVCAAVIKEIGKTTPVLGVCLGMQGMAHVFGGRVIPAKRPVHGKTSTIRHDGENLFAGLPQNIEVMRYHSLVVDKITLPKQFKITAKTTEKIGEIMGLRHRSYPIFGIQFHPESFATFGGREILTNFLLTK
ncbi:MAG: aminodeoxychorismate/anthranilate synthase component II [bacterium]|nr:aminodeoxychorismate/anthranilate synthase component II [bacterium]